MVTGLFYDTFDLLRDFNPDYTPVNTAESSPFSDSIRMILQRYIPSEPIFTPTAITLREFDTPTGSSNQYIGTFEQSENGTISGTIIAIVGYSTSAIVTRIFDGPLPQPFPSPRPTVETDPIELSQARETLFVLTDLDLDFEDFYEMLITPPDVMPFSAIESFLFAGNDNLVRSALEPDDNVVEINGYGGDDRISGSSNADSLLLGGDGNDRLWSQNGNDTLLGGAGDDSLIGGDGYDILNGDDGNDGLFGHFGTNVLIGGKGDDELIGSHFSNGIFRGYATAVYEGSADSYTIILSGGGRASPQTIIDRVADRDGVDTFQNVQKLDFLDRSITLDLANFNLTSGSSQMAEIATLYTAYFNRAPDALGLNYWAGQSRGEMSLEEMSDYFSQSAEAQSILAFNGTTKMFVTAVYENVLNRSPDPDGLAFWTAALDANVLPRSTFILDVIRGALTDPMTEEIAEMAEQRASDVAYLEDTAELGLYFARDKGMTNVESAYAVFDIFDGTAESLAESMNVVDTLYDAALDPTDGELVVQLTGFRDDPDFF